MFRQSWTYLNDNFYDAKFHGANWKDVHAQYAPLAAPAKRTDELRRIISLMLGELNASHLGIFAPQRNVPAAGDRAVWDCDLIGRSMKSTGPLRVTEVIPLSPAALAKIKPEDYLIAVEGTSDYLANQPR